MDTTNLSVVIDLMLRGIAQVQAYAALVQKSRAEGRDVTSEELAELKAGYATDRDDLVALAAAKRNER